MHRELVVVPQRNERRQRDTAARPPVEAGSRPDLAPGVACDEILERLVNGVVRAIAWSTWSSPSTSRRVFIPPSCDRSCPCLLRRRTVSHLSQRTVDERLGRAEIGRRVERRRPLRRSKARGSIGRSASANDPPEDDARAVTHRARARVAASRPSSPPRRARRARRRSRRRSARGSRASGRIDDEPVQRSARGVRPLPTESERGAERGPLGVPGAGRPLVLLADGRHEDAT